MSSNKKNDLPTIIQGGMGVGVSGWRLANSVARMGHLGVVSGTGIDNVMVRTLQKGDAGGHIRRALAQLPLPSVSQRILKEYFHPEGLPDGQAFKRLPVVTANLTPSHQETIVAANFVEVFLAREGHTGLVGINLLEKVQMTTLPSLYGAMLAGVDFVLMGAGIPREIPAILDFFSHGENASLKLYVIGANPEDDFRVKFSPQQFFADPPPQLNRPKFLAIISSSALATTLAKKASGKVDGFVIEGPTAGGHNAPPRGTPLFSDRGEPIYGPKDIVDLESIKKLGLPFWLAGGYGTAERYREALALGAVGIQVGTPFALTKESGLTGLIKSEILEVSTRGELDVFTDPKASPTGFPFKVARLANTLSDPVIYAERPRLCDIGYLRQPYKKANGELGYRCPAEPIDTFITKGGTLEETEQRRCLCNALFANIGLGNIQPKGYRELPFVTIGDDAKFAHKYIGNDPSEITATDIITKLKDSSDIA